ncbi:MAG TPA: helix-turn-helix domain-containing protein [Candidatus Aphodoplasma excrementigallinarum]|uniref:Helix-turn-helix domain-containing protein n=1 Tax=Candidatus Aphodoplasma excrementigallinarum TaxID=2840673 RepID=A0A9D1NII2_9FIRM|nr:helix-turn-helix domain-containing protein [Candidatus Aphodoplasma excrementigallinarum]
MKGYIDADALLTPIFVERERRESRMQTVKTHVHNFYEMYVLLDGQIDKFVESRTYHLKPFDLIIIPPNRLHKSILCKDYRHERVVIYFDERSVHDAALLRRLDQDLGVITLPNDAAKRVFKLINILLQEKESSAWHESYVSGVLTEMLVVILRSERGGKLPYAGVRFEKIIDYVKENCREPISLTGVAGRFFVSDAHLSRMFRKNTGFTFTQYVNYQRVIYAQTLLTEKDITIGDVAMQSGFENLTHFGRVFRQLTGYAPREYRKNAKPHVETEEHV